MAGIHSWNGQEIDELPAEVLGFRISDIPRSTLKDVAIRLNKDTVPGNWETLAEKLGFTQSTKLDELIERARVQNNYPGFLMLQEWALKAGSTAFVLLHNLREIQREDVLSLLVQKLFELNSLQLSVRVEDRAGVLQFLRVPTRKNAPLHASLDNILQHPLYWYDIIGPRRDIDWNTASGDLQGVMLTLKLRGEPNQHSLEQIYGTSQKPGQQQQECSMTAMQIEGGRIKGHNEIQWNIPPTKPEFCVTFGQGQIDVTTHGQVRLKNMSSTEPLNIPPRPEHNLNIPPSASQACHPPPPPACRPRPDSPKSAMALHGPLSMLENAQPLTQFSQSSGRAQGASPQTDNRACAEIQPENLPRLSLFNTFLPMTSHFSQNGLAAAAAPVCRGAQSNHSNTFPYEVCPSSLTDAKQPVSVFYNNENFTCGSEDSDSDFRQQRGVTAFSMEQGRQQQQQQHYGHQQQQQQHQGFVGLESPDRETAVPPCRSLLHQDYIAHNSVIEFCNNPTSPLSCSSGSSPSTPQGHPPTTSTASSSTSSSSPSVQQSENFPHFLNPQPSLEEESEEGLHVCSKWQQSGYVPHSFIQQMSQSFHKSASAPTLEKDEEGMDFTEEQGLPTGAETASSLPPRGSKDAGSKPPPCGYSLGNHQYQNIKFTPPPLAHSVSMDTGDKGYIDMTGTHAFQGENTHPSTVENFWLHSSPSSFDSYGSNSNPEENGAQTTAYSLDTGMKRCSEERLDNMLNHPRNRRPLNLASDNVFQPRNRGPVTQDHDMLLSEDSSPEYCYIDPVPVQGEVGGRDGRGPSSSSSGQRRSSGGNLGGRISEGRRQRPHFHRELSDSELQQVPGWNSSVNNKTVEQEMQKYINDDGNFVIWKFTGDEEKYVISVSHLRSIRHYAVYETEKEGKVSYCIFPKFRFSGLAELVKHCMTKGVSEPTKTFKSPDGKETQRGSGRFSHVRLKTPIPPRRRN